MSNNKDIKIEEGKEVKGNVRPKPSVPRPAPPHGQSPRGGGASKPQK